MMMMTSTATGVERFVEASPRTLTGTCELTGVQHCSPRTLGGSHDTCRSPEVPGGSAGAVGRIIWHVPCAARRTRCVAVVTQPCHSDTSGMLCAHQRAAVLDASELNVPVTVRGLSS